ncbi:MAG TPA: hypothetical protein VF899_07635 [Pyrinomonadaceae bacterium]
MASKKLKEIRGFLLFFPPDIRIVRTLLILVFGRSVEIKTREMDGKSKQQTANSKQSIAEGKEQSALAALSPWF